MGLQKEIFVDWMDNHLVDDESCGTVSTSVPLTLVLREKANMVSFPDDDID